MSTMIFAGSTCDLPAIPSTLERHALADCTLPTLPPAIVECPDLTTDIVAPSGADSGFRHAVTVGPITAATILLDADGLPFERLGTGTATLLETVAGGDDGTAADLANGDTVPIENRGAFIPAGTPVLLGTIDDRWNVIGSPLIWPLLAITTTTIAAKNGVKTPIGTAILLIQDEDGTVRTPNGHRLAIAGSWSSAKLYEKIPDLDPDTGEPMDESDPGTTYHYAEINGPATSPPTPPVPTIDVRSHHGSLIPRFSFLPVMPMGRHLHVTAPPPRPVYNAYTIGIIEPVDGASFGEGSAVVLAPNLSDKTSPFVGPIEILGIDDADPDAPPPPIDEDPALIAIVQNTQGTILPDTFILVALIDGLWQIIEGDCKRSTTGTPFF